MPRHLPLFDRRGLLLLVMLLLSAGFFATTLLGYFVSKHAIRNTLIGQDLPLTASNIYAEIQKDLVRPVLVSSTMASDTFLRDWVLRTAVEAAPLGPRAPQSTISIGIAEYDGRETPEHWIGRADAALYRAKHAGRNRVVADPPAAAAQG
jgi:GGDEF domain-containing protein